MKTGKRVAVALLLAVFALLTLAACGGTQDPPAPIEGEKTKDPAKMLEWVQACGEEAELELEEDPALGEGLYKIFDYNQKINEASRNSNLELVSKLTEEKNAVAETYFGEKELEYWQILVPSDTGLLEEYAFKRTIRGNMSYLDFVPKKTDVFLWTDEDSYSKYYGNTYAYVVFTD